MDSSLSPGGEPNSAWPFLVDKFRQLCGYRFPRLGPAAFAGIFKTLPSSIDTRLFSGIRATLDLRDETQRTTYWFGTRFEQPTPQVLLEWAADATHFFDIGSNYGFYSFFLYSVLSHLQIYAFEPNPKIFSRLSEICAANRATRIHPLPYGLSDERSRLRFLQLSDNTGHSSFATTGGQIENDASIRGASFTECEVVRFDDAIRESGLAHPTRPSWVAKIDVEGYEMKVLRGMTDALRTHAFKGICIELIAENLCLCGTSVEEVDTHLRSFGYRPMTLSDAQIDRNPNSFYVPTKSDTTRGRALN